MNNETLLKTLEEVIRNLEREEDRPDISSYVHRRLGNILLHLKQLRDDVSPK